MENKKPEGEVDLISLFEYIKSNIKSLFKGIGSLLQWLLKLVLDFFGIFVRWKFVVLGFTFLGLISGFFMADILGPSFTYACTVRTNYGSQTALYAHVEEMDKENKNNISVSIEPIKNQKAIINNYLSFAKSEGKDSIFFKNYDITKFGEILEPIDFSQHVIYFSAPTTIAAKPYLDKILTKVEQVPSLKNLRDASVKSKKELLVRLKKDLNRIDTLLIAQTERKKIEQPLSDIIVNGSQQKDHLEPQLLEVYNQRTLSIVDTEADLYESGYIVEVLSEPVLTKNKWLKKLGFIRLFIYGLIAGLVLALLLELFFFLQKRNRTA